MLKEKGLEEQVMHIITDSLDTNGQTGAHPLYLGLRHAKETWQLQPYPLEKVLDELKNSNKKIFTDKNVEEQTTKTDIADTEAFDNRKVTKLKKGRRKDVLQDKESAGC